MSGSNNSSPSSLVTLNMKVAALCLFISLFLNSFLLFLLSMTKKLLGSYRHLLTVYSFFLLSYNCLDFIMQPAVHIHKNGFICFATGTWKYRPIGTILAVLQSLSQGICMTLLSINFVYRYSIIHTHGLGKYWYIWPVVAAGLMTVWAMADVFLVLPCDYFDWYFRESVFQKYGIDTIDTGYYAVVYITENLQTGQQKYYIPSIFCLGLVALCQLLTSFLIGTCGYYLYKSIKDASNFSSGIMAKVHKDLFWTLVLQTIAPCLMIYVPGVSLIVTPLLDFDASKLKIEEIQPLLISVFPIVDTLIVLICFKGFRNTLKKMFCNKQATVEPSIRLQHIT